MQVDSKTSPQNTPPVGEVEAVEGAIERTVGWLYQQQAPEGFWCGELEGDSILQSEYLLLLAWLGETDRPVARKIAAYLSRQQDPDGGWSQYPRGRIDVSASVKAYFALKIMGADPESEPMRRACRAIREAGGADVVNSFTRFYLALLGQISYAVCPAIPPEMVLLPRFAPVNLYRISAWSRTIFVPLSIMWAFRPARPLDPKQGITELFLESPENWPPLRCPGATEGRGFWGLSWERTFRTLDRILHGCEKLKLRPLRKRALRKAEQWMLERFEASDGLGAIFPPIIWSIVALRCLGYASDSPEVLDCHEQLERLMIEERDSEEATGSTIRLQPCLSPVWDTAITLRALAGAGESLASPQVRRAVQWLLDKEVRQPGDWSYSVAAEPSGWFFEHHNAFYPDIDDTTMVLMALRELQHNSHAWRAGADQAQQAVWERIDKACGRAGRWMLAMQNRDGGWGAFDKDNDQEFLCRVPFADHNAMIDPSSPDITARVVEALRIARVPDAQQAIQRALQYIRRHQESDGAWYGRWGVNYIYGTWQVLVGYGEVPEEMWSSQEAVAVQRGVAWLKLHQQENGGWGESPDSYFDPDARGRGVATASQTAWALLGLIAAGQAETPEVRRGIGYLLQTQGSGGRWEETEFTGTGFPQVFYLRYHLYSIYFPLLTLTRYRSAFHSAIPGAPEKTLARKR